MIAYDLKCADGHTFEGWFDNGEAFQAQMERGLVSCPICGSIEIERMLSTFAISRSRQQDAGPPRQAQPWELFLKHVHDRFEDVGSAFATEALKMHYGVAEHRNIRGVSSAPEEDMLREEGVSFFKIVARDPSQPPEDD